MLIIYSILLISDLKTIVAEQNEHNITNDVEGRIIGGVPTSIENCPYTAIFFNEDHLCGGVILNSYSVLTAAHCFDHNKDKSKMLIEVNAIHVFEYMGEIFYVLAYLIHENYNQRMSFFCDVALIFLTKPIKFGKGKKRAILSNSNAWMKIPNISITAVGWGWTKFGGPVSEGLLETQLQYVPLDICQKLHNFRLPEDMFCLYGGGARDTCKGDSGGGVVWKKVVLGLVSHGDGCAKKNKPSIYLNVVYHRGWIKYNLIKFHRNYCRIKERYGDRSNTSRKPFWPQRPLRS